MQIFVAALSGKIIELDVDPNSHIDDIKEMVEDKEEIPFDMQQLIYEGQQLDDERTLQDHGIPMMSTLSLVIVNDMMRIFVSIVHAGETIVVGARATGTASDLR